MSRRSESAAVTSKDAARPDKPQAERPAAGIEMAGRMPRREQHRGFRAEWLVHLARTGFFKPVYVKSLSAHAAPM
jgi:hypothetical protein